MKSKKLTDLCNPKQWKTIAAKELLEEGYPVYGANGIVGYWREYNHETETLAIACRGTCGTVNVIPPKSYINGNAMCLDNISNDVDLKYLFYYLKAYDFNKVISGTAVPQITIESLKKIDVLIPSKKEQKRIVYIFDILSQIIESKEKENKRYDDLIKARFIEMFGDLRTNNKNWQVVSFNGCASIDTNMIRDFDGYEDYPHIGIDSIEKDTGRIFGYRTISEDGVISGKYLFTPKHIIYSKIRPNLNKVALPDFIGLCSADAYPILVKDTVCTREYFGYTLRSRIFLDYILAFSSRTNLPKVNKSQVEGFKLPLPPIELQNQFADFVQQVDKSRFDIKKSITELEREVVYD